MNQRPDVFLLNVAFDSRGIHGLIFFRDPPDPEHREVIIHPADGVADYQCEPARGDARDGWEPFLTETRRLIALIRPDTSAERS